MLWLAVLWQAGRGNRETLYNTVLLIENIWHCLKSLHYLEDGQKEGEKCLCFSAPSNISSSLPFCSPSSSSLFLSRVCFWGMSGIVLVTESDWHFCLDCPNRFDLRWVRKPTVLCCLVLVSNVSPPSSPTDSGLAAVLRSLAHLALGLSPAVLPSSASISPLCSPTAQRPAADWAWMASALFKLTVGPWWRRRTKKQRDSQTEVTWTTSSTFHHGNQQGTPIASHDRLPPCYVSIHL